MTLAQESELTIPDCTGVQLSHFHLDNAPFPVFEALRSEEADLQETSSTRSSRVVRSAPYGQCELSSSLVFFPLFSVVCEEPMALCARTVPERSSVAGSWPAVDGWCRPSEVSAVFSATEELAAHGVGPAANPL